MPRKTKQQIGDGPAIGSPVVDSRQRKRPKECNSAPASKSKFTYDWTGKSNTELLPSRCSAIALRTNAVGPWPLTPSCA
jgi:hypothetical protein